MGPGPRDSEMAPVEELLVASRPVPRPGFSAELERRLLPSRSARKRAWRPALAGAVGALALAAVFGVLGLAGAGPLSGGGTSDVRAGDDCRYVTVTGPTRVPYVVDRPDGELEIRFRRERAERIVKRCR